MALSIPHGDYLQRPAQAGCDNKHSFSGFILPFGLLLAFDLAANFFFSSCRVHNDAGRG
jgi:hypothetical protein